MQVYGILGNPVEHSLSPPMHEAAYDAMGIDARYVTFEPDEDDLPAAIAGARALGVAGLNVTMPFKEQVLEIEGILPDGTAERIGAVNTLDLTDGTVKGFNTDATGARMALAEAGVEFEGATATVVGAGGAGRAITVGLAEAGARVVVANRTHERAEDLAASAGEDVTAHPVGKVSEAIAASDVLVNATSVGMKTEKIPVPPEAIHSDLTVLDAVYQPLETRLLRKARAVGATPVDGGRMLLYQGAAAFEIWTEQAAPVEEMERALYERLGERI